MLILTRRGSLGDGTEITIETHRKDLIEFVHDWLEAAFPRAVIRTRLGRETRIVAASDAIVTAVEASLLELCEGVGMAWSGKPPDAESTCGICDRPVLPGGDCSILLTRAECLEVLTSCDDEELRKALAIAIGDG